MNNKAINTIFHKKTYIYISPEKILQIIYNTIDVTIDEFINEIKIEIDSETIEIDSEPIYLKKTLKRYLYIFFNRKNFYEQYPEIIEKNKYKNQIQELIKSIEEDLDNKFIENVFFD